VVNNYENQFKGSENDSNLKFWLFQNKDFQNFIDPVIVQNVYKQFKEKNELKYSHPLSTLLTLSLFSKIKN